MRRIAFWLCGLLLAGGMMLDARGALQEVGTLTLTGETVVFHTPVKDVVYDFMKCPGLFLLKYDKKITTAKDGAEVDVSEALFADETGRRFTLVEAKPQDVTREMSGDKTVWKFSVKFR